MEKNKKKLNTAGARDITDRFQSDHTGRPSELPFQSHGLRSKLKDERAFALGLEEDGGYISGIFSFFFSIISSHGERSRSES